MLRRLLIKPVLTLLRWVVTRINSEDPDPWKATGDIVDHRKLASGSRHHFGWYLDGESTVEVSTVNDIVEWLSQCEYDSDISLFNEHDFWQHPRTFERLRRGDCEDYALWAWRKALELNTDARFFLGRYVRARSPHAWVVIAHGDFELIYDPTSPKRPALRSLRECETEYEPWFSVGRDLKPRQLYGYYRGLKDRLTYAD